MGNIRVYMIGVACFIGALSPAVANAVPASFYKAPKHLSGKHGSLIRSAKLTNTAALTAASSNRVILYRSTSITGKKIAVSGVVSIPKGKAPKGGWPVISWDHGTTGIADICAPSKDSTSNPAHAYNDYIYPELNTWLNAGYAVVRTDYEGLGTAGTHPYLIGESEGRSSIDSVLAARQLNKKLSKNWVAAGHSQGGHAALFTAALARQWAPSLKLKGVAAFAPASHIKEEVQLAKALTSPSSLSGIGALLVSGAQAASPSTVKFADLLTPEATALLPQVETDCLGQLGAANSWGGLAPSQIVKADYDYTAINKVFDKSDPSTLKLKVPVLVLQGDADTTVFKSFTDPLVQSLETNGATVDYKTYAGVSHGGVVASGLADTNTWLSSVLPAK